MADVAPFRAVRYADPTPEVTAPPYDVIEAGERDRLLALHPHNVVRLTLAESEDEAGRLYRSWLESGVLVRDERPAVWVLEQEDAGPDGVVRRRRGVVASLRAEPYETGTVLPHERTHAAPKESRLRLLRAARAQLEPIFLLHEGPSPLAPPDRPPDLEAEGTRLWRVEEPHGVREAFAGRQLLIADGHHRYETALAYHAEQGTDESARLPAVLVSTDDPGLRIFATHRLVPGRADVPANGGAPVEEALARLAAEPYDAAVALAYANGAARAVHGEPGELDVELVDRLVGHEGIRYTPDWREAVRCVDAGEAGTAFLLRPLRIEDVFARARRGGVLPQKSTYFHPKLRSGLLFHPLDP